MPLGRQQTQGTNGMNPVKHSGFQRLKFRLNRMLLKRLLSVNDLVLKDVGLTREELIWACGLPIWMDAAVEMRKVADQRLASRCGGPTR